MPSLCIAADIYIATFYEALSVARRDFNRFATAEENNSNRLFEEIKIY